MKEYILLAFIAAVGMTGLFSIHHEVKSSQQQYSYLQVGTFSCLQVSKMKNRMEECQLSVDTEIVSPDVLIRINNFRRDATYFLDCGNGERICIRDAQQLIRYDKSGKKLIKLLKDNILIDAIELTIDTERAKIQLASS